MTSPPHVEGLALHLQQIQHETEGQCLLTHCRMERHERRRVDAPDRVDPPVCRPT